MVLNANFIGRKYCACVLVLAQYRIFLVRSDWVYKKCNNDTLKKKAYREILRDGKRGLFNFTHTVFLSLQFRETK